MTSKIEDDEIMPINTRWDPKDEDRAFAQVAEESKKVGFNLGCPYRNEPVLGDRWCYSKFSEEEYYRCRFVGDCRDMYKKTRQK